MEPDTQTTAMLARKPVPPPPIPSLISLILIGFVWTVAAFSTYHAFLIANATSGLIAAVSLYFMGVSLHWGWHVRQSLQGMLLGLMGGAAAAAVFTACQRADSKYLALLSVIVMSMCMGLQWGWIGALYVLFEVLLLLLQALTLMLVSLLSFLEVIFLILLLISVHDVRMLVVLGPAFPILLAAILRRTYEKD